MNHPQNAGIEQINQAIAEMDTVTQQNAALVEQAAAAAQAMQDQAATLAKLVSKFVLSSNAASDTDAGAPPRPMLPSGKIGASVGVPLTLANSVRRAG
jgi:methyl-accepting chemotaxis protein